MRQGVKVEITSDKSYKLKSYKIFKWIIVTTTLGTYIYFQLRYFHNKMLKRARYHISVNILVQCQVIFLTLIWRLLTISKSIEFGIFHKTEFRKITCSRYVMFMFEYYTIISVYSRIRIQVQNGEMQDINHK